ncbi:MAG: caspase family protein [Treponema sp.]|jgi:hypothetical protein|nr:caspase family protein [Treponema sp.]
MKKMPLGVLFCMFAVLGAVISAPLVYGAPEDAARRFGIFIGSNNGGRDRTMLRYAVSDARAVSRVFTQMGGIAAGDSVLLVDPNLGDLGRQIAALRNRVLAARETHKRTEIVFYYSGHSDEEGLLLNRERYIYRELRERINGIPSDMRLVILDSCSSGAFTRAKGGIKTQPFLFDNSAAAEGYAFLTSSTASETSQESDAIKSSYFTHSLLAGLRGAADTVGDGRVTLNEVYRYAYDETLARTEVSRYGAQHPSYDMQITGAGDMVLTDIKETSAGLIIDGGISGRLSIRDRSDYLVAEITKTQGHSMELGLEPGMYRITLQQGNAYFRAEVTLSQDSRATLSPADFIAVAAPSSTARGEGEPDAEPEKVIPVDLQFAPRLGIFGFNSGATNYVLFGVLGAAGHNLRGFGLSAIGLINTGDVLGFQASALFNYTGGKLDGIQMSAIFNLTQSNAQGAVQASGIFNYAGGKLDGIQMSGVFNLAQGDARGGQASGIFNYAGGSRDGVQLGGILNLTQGTVQGSQIGGIFNYSGGGMNGIQLGGIFNMTRGGFQGIQTGLVNYSGESSDGEEGGGLSIGLVNISKNEKVVPIGLVNIVKNGVFHPAIWYDDMRFLNLGLRSGSKYFYSIFSVGIQDEGFDDSLLISRGGLGGEIPLGRSFINLDVTAGSMIDRKEIDNNGNLLLQARLSGGFKLFEHMGIFGGVSYNWFLIFNDTFRDRADSLGISALRWENGRNIHRIGFFGGIQF